MCPEEPGVQLQKRTNTHSVPAGDLSGEASEPRRAGVEACDLVREGAV
jgi:hypothetical protein